MMRLDVLTDVFFLESMVMNVLLHGCTVHTPENSYGSYTLMVCRCVPLVFGWFFSLGGNQPWLLSHFPSSLVGHASEGNYFLLMSPPATEFPSPKKQ